MGGQLSENPLTLGVVLLRHKHLEPNIGMSFVYFTVEGNVRNIVHRSFYLRGYSTMWS
jgi:hypothetical protein